MTGRDATLTQLFLRCSALSVPFGLSSRSHQQHGSTRNSYLTLFDRELHNLRVFVKGDRLA